MKQEDYRRSAEWIEGYTWGMTSKNPYDFFAEYKKHAQWCYGQQARKRREK